jgi:hypothetical protein
MIFQGTGDLRELLQVRRRKLVQGLALSAVLVESLRKNLALQLVRT